MTDKNAILDSQLLLKTVVESSKDVLIVAIDHVGRLAFFNDAWKEATLIAYGINVHQGMSIYDCFTNQEDLVKSRNNIEKALTGNRFNLIQEYGEVNKSYFDITYNPIIDVAGDVKGVAIFAKDITERINARVKLEQALEENYALLLELRHRVKNNLTMILSIIDLEINEYRDSPACQALEKIYGRVMSISSLYDSLNSSNSVKTVRLDIYLNSVITSVLSAYTLNDLVIRKMINLDEVTTSVRIALPLGLILNELLTNAFKHAFTGRKEGTLDIRLSHNQNSIVLSVSDDGIGLPEDYSKVKGAGMGMELVLFLAKQLYAELNIDGSKGARFQFTIPCNPADP